VSSDSPPPCALPSARLLAALTRRSGDGPGGASVARACGAARGAAAWRRGARGRGPAARGAGWCARRRAAAAVLARRAGPPGAPCRRGGAGAGARCGLRGHQAPGARVLARLPRLFRRKSRGGCAGLLCRCRAADRGGRRGQGAPLATLLAGAGWWVRGCAGRGHNAAAARRQPPLSARGARRRPWRRHRGRRRGARPAPPRPGGARAARDAPAAGPTVCGDRPWRGRPRPRGATATLLSPSPASSGGGGGAPLRGGVAPRTRPAPPPRLRRGDGGRGRSRGAAPAGAGRPPGLCRGAPRGLRSAVPVRGGAARPQGRRPRRHERGALRLPGGAERRRAGGAPQRTRRPRPPGRPGRGPGRRAARGARREQGSAREPHTSHNAYARARHLHPRAPNLLLPTKPTARCGEAWEGLQQIAGPRGRAMAPRSRACDLDRLDDALLVKVRRCGRPWRCAAGPGGAGAASAPRAASPPPAAPRAAPCHAPCPAISAMPRRSSGAWQRKTPHTTRPSPPFAPQRSCTSSTPTRASPTWHRPAAACGASPPTPAAGCALSRRGRRRHLQRPRGPR
jgi:hypothetical protein